LRLLWLLLWLLRLLLLRSTIQPLCCSLSQQLKLRVGLLLLLLSRRCRQHRTLSQPGSEAWLRRRLGRPAKAAAGPAGEACASSQCAWWAIEPLLANGFHACGRACLQHNSRLGSHSLLLVLLDGRQGVLLAYGTEVFHWRLGDGCVSQQHLLRCLQSNHTKRKGIRAQMAARPLCCRAGRARPNRQSTL
jgi:hypothetical protein